jgi:hypothetical protein
MAKAFSQLRPLRAWNISQRPTRVILTKGDILHKEAETLPFPPIVTKNTHPITLSQEESHQGLH